MKPSIYETLGMLIDKGITVHPLSMKKNGSAEIMVIYDHKILLISYQGDDIVGGKEFVFSDQKSNVECEEVINKLMNRELP